MKVEAAHKEILRTAAKIANRDRRKPNYLQGEIFTVPPNTEKLALRVSPLVEDAVKDKRFENRSEDEVWNELHDIVRDAVKEAIAKHYELFVGLIVEEARKGSSYFDLTSRTDDPV